MEKISQITTGKAKSLFTTNEPDQLIMEFRDDTSAFDGKKIGTHNGAHNYTIGQRKGLSIGGKKEPLFVLLIYIKDNNSQVSS